MGKKEKSLGGDAEGRAVCAMGTSEVNYPSSCFSVNYPCSCFSVNYPSSCVYPCIASPLLSSQQPIDVNVIDRLEGLKDAQLRGCHSWAQTGPTCQGHTWHLPSSPQNPLETTRLSIPSPHPSCSPWFHSAPVSLIPDRRLDILHPSGNTDFREQEASTRALVTIMPPKGRSCCGKTP